MGGSVGAPPPSHPVRRGVCGSLVSSPNEIRDWITHSKYILISDVTQGPSRTIFSQVKKQKQQKPKTEHPPKYCYNALLTENLYSLHSRFGTSLTW